MDAFPPEILSRLLEDTLSYLRAVAKTTPTLLANREEAAYFPPPSPPGHKRVSKIAPAPPPPAAPSAGPTPPPAAISPEASEGVVMTPGGGTSRKKSFLEMHHLIQKHFPGFKLRDTIPDDSLAKKMGRLWEASYLTSQIVVIGFGEIGAGLEFLKNLTQAIDTLVAPAHLVEGAQLEKEQGWNLLLNSPCLKAVLSSPWHLWKSSSLSKHYKQNGSTQKQFLGSHPLLLLEPSTVYLKNPDRKRELWHTISTQLLS